MSKSEIWYVENNHYAWAEPEGEEGPLYEIIETDGEFILWVKTGEEFTRDGLGSSDAISIQEAIKKANEKCSLS